MNGKQIETVVLGYGFSGQTFFSPFLHLHEGFHLRGALERHQKRIQKNYSDAISYESIEEVLADEQVDLVVVNTPIDTHFDLACQVLKAKKNVIVEKAFTTTAREAKILYELAKANDRHLFVFQNRRYDSDFRTFKKVLESGKLGKLVDASIAYDFFIPEVRGDVHTEWAVSGGEYNNRGSHITDQAVYLFGIPETVIADFAALRPNSQVEDYFDVTLIYPDKRVKLAATDISFYHRPGYMANGMKGSYIQDRTDIQEDLLLKGVLPTPNDWCGTAAFKKGTLAYLNGEESVVEAVSSEVGNYYDYFEAVWQTMVNGAPAPVSGVDGYKTMVVMEAVRKSAETGTKVKVNYEPLEA